MLPLSSDFSTSAQRREQRNVLIASGTLFPESAVTELRLPDGRTLQLSTEALLRAATHPSGQVETGAQAEHLESSEVVVPLVEERLHLTRRTVETGTVRLQKTVQAYDTELDEVLAVRSFEVERVVLNQPVDTVPQVRQEGDTTIYPMIEEQLIVTRQLLLREELRVTRRDSERHDTRRVTLRRETIDVERRATPVETPDVS